MAKHDEEIDRLYQLPPGEFTSARNALAKELGAAEIKQLEKPTAPAWAVNQLFWKQRKTYDALVTAAEQLRAAYRQQLSGKSVDIRGAEAVHKDAVRVARQSVRELIEATEGKASDTVMDAVGETLDALPTADIPGRLTKPLKRMGFEALQGLPIASNLKLLKPKPQEIKKPSDTKDLSEKERRANEAKQRERAMETERLRFAEVAERDAEAALERAARAVERAERTRDRIEQELGDATKELKKLQGEEAKSRAALAKAASERERLAKRV